MKIAKNFGISIISFKTFLKVEEAFATRHAWLADSICKVQVHEKRSLRKRKSTLSTIKFTTYTPSPLSQLRVKFDTLSAANASSSHEDASSCFTTSNGKLSGRSKLFRTTTLSKVRAALSSS